MEAKTPTNMSVALRPAHRRAVEQFIDQIDGPFRRSSVSAVLYPLTSPRSQTKADKLADAAIKELARAGRIQRHEHLHWVRVAKARTLTDGRAAPELPTPVKLQLNTRCPRKWLAVDLETGEVWVGTDNADWRRAAADDVQALKRVTARGS